MFDVYGVRWREGVLVPVIVHDVDDPFRVAGELSVCNGFITEASGVVATISPDGVIQEI